MGKSWDSFSNNTNSALGGQSPANKKDKTPFPKRGKPISGWCEKDRKANKNFQKWNEEWAKEALRIAKPGAFAFIFGGTRTFHRLACAIEDAGWQIRDDIMLLLSMDDKERALFLSLNMEQQQAFLELFASQNLLLWIYGSGFPKSLDISRQLDKVAGVEREVGPPNKWAHVMGTAPKDDTTKVYGRGQTDKRTDDPPTTPEVKQWDGFGTALKPAFESILVAMKPIEKNFANNALVHGVAGINVDAGRINYINEDDKNVGGRNKPTTSKKSMYGGKSYFESSTKAEYSPANNKGRWPANLILSRSENEYLLKDDVTPNQLRELAEWVDAHT